MCRKHLVCSDHGDGGGGEGEEGARRGGAEEGHLTSGEDQDRDNEGHHDQDRDDQDLDEEDRCGVDDDGDSVGVGDHLIRIEVARMQCLRQKRRKMINQRKLTSTG